MVYRCAIFYQDCIFLYYRQMKIIRAYELQKGDEFMRTGVVYKVYAIDDKIRFYHGSSNAVESDRYTIGVRSRERVLLVSKLVVKKNERP